MSNPWKEKVLKFNRKRKSEEEKAFELDTLLERIKAMPKGQLKKLVEDVPGLEELLNKY